MLNLKLRDEFLGSQMPGTAIALCRKDNTRAAQETRDLIRILAPSYRERGEKVPIITPADFFVDDDTCGVQSLLDSIATVGEQERLRQGRKLVITSDHGYALSKLFSSEEIDPDVIEKLRETFGAARYKKVNGPWQERFMPPIVVSANEHHIALWARENERSRAASPMYVMGG